MWVAPGTTSGKRPETRRNTAAAGADTSTVSSFHNNVSFRFSLRAVASPLLVGLPRGCAQPSAFGFTQSLSLSIFNLLLLLSDD